LQTGVSVLDQCIERWGSSKVAICPSLSLADGIQAMRWLLQQNTRFHPRCGDGVEALRQYHYAYDEDRRTFSGKPEHTWASHAADAFRYIACVVRTSEAMTRKDREPEKPAARPVSSITINELMEQAMGRRSGGRI
jgi:phage terminase large subunit